MEKIKGLFESNLHAMTFIKENSKCASTIRGKYISKKKPHEYVTLAQATVSYSRGVIVPKFRPIQKQNY
jgi:hypothetical protein